MSARLVLVCALLGVAGCASKEATIQTALDAGMLACDTLRVDPTIPRTAEVDAFCERMVRGCWEPFPEAKP